MILYRGYRIDVWSARIGGRFRVVDPQQVVVREGYANTKRDATLAAKDWVNSQQQHTHGSSSK